MSATLVIGAGAALLALLARQNAQGQPVEETDPTPSEETDQLPTRIESVGVSFTTWGDAEMTPQAAANVRAFLDMIAWAEGTAGGPENGYRVMFGPREFYSMVDHPRQLFSFTNSRGEQLRTSAAGRYQFLQRTWDELRDKLHLQDFGPASQDAAAIELIRQRGALEAVKAGRLAEAIRKCAKTWASFPGAGYAQPERKIQKLAQAFSDAGGSTT